MINVCLSQIHYQCKIYEVCKIFMPKQQVKTLIFRFDRFHTNLLLFQMLFRVRIEYSKIGNSNIFTPF